MFSVYRSRSLSHLIKVKMPHVRDTYDIIMFLKALCEKEKLLNNICVKSREKHLYDSSDRLGGVVEEHPF